MGHLIVINLTKTKSNWSSVVENRKLKAKQYVTIFFYLIIKEGIIECP